MFTRADGREFIYRCGFISKPLFLMSPYNGLYATAELGLIRGGRYKGYFVLTLVRSPKQTHTLYWTDEQELFEQVKTQIRAKNGKIITAWTSHKRHTVIFAIPKQRKLMKGLNQ